MGAIFGVGIDLIDLGQFTIIYGDEDPDLMARCFTSRELAASGTGVDRLAKLAARFAVKEATFKALGGGLAIAYSEIEVANDEGGKPQVILHGGARTLAEVCAVTMFYVSLTHSASSAAAVVVATGPR